MTGALEPEAMLLVMPGLDGVDIMVEAARRGGARSEPACRDWRKEGAVSSDQSFKVRKGRVCGVVGDVVSEVIEGGCTVE